MPSFLDLDEVLALHEDQIRRYGGMPGLRDLGLLSSAVAMPAATFEGEHLHEDLFAMAAAYLFHLAKNHPFVDGNKRIALAASLAFLWINGQRVEAQEDDLVDLVLGVADGSVSKAEIAV
ncbi:MAG: type II toxin-antitoxin system death-on-curing family toxin, partial [Acidobacteriota bacterium]